MSKQDVSTPADLVRAIESRFGKLTIDLAANESNAKAPRWLGPGSDRAIDSLAEEWIGWFPVGDCVAWLNNPYVNTKRWIKQCFDTVNADNAGHGWKILQLIPASVCANYWINYIDPCAYQIKLTPRPFADEVRDCCLIVWTPEQLVGIEIWKWDEQA